MRQAIDSLDKVYKLRESTKWKFEGENKIGNAVWTLEDEDSGCRAVKGEARVNFPPDQIFYQVADISDDTQTFDSMFNKVSLVEKLG